VPDVRKWDAKLYEGSASYYTRGRVPYPPEVADVLRDELALDGTGRLLDVGTGPGSLALLLAPFFAEVVGVDPDPGMIAEAGREAAEQGATNARWVQLPAEALPHGLGSFRVATFAQSFHWMDREKVAAAVRSMLRPRGHWVHVNATTHKGVRDAAGLKHPQPPRDEIEKLIRSYIGSTRRPNPSGEETVMTEAGFSGPKRLTVPAHVHERSEDDVVASVFSLSWAAPHLFGDRLGKFEAALRDLLRSVSSEGKFAERAREIELVIWAA
jgi:SAM-dependent methyltransferase